jgi:hypothetical protein
MNSRCLHSFGRRLPALFPFFVLILSTPFQAHPQQRNWQLPHLVEQSSTLQGSRSTRQP